MPGYEAVLRYGFVAPAGTPRPIIERINAEMRALLASDDMRKRLAAEGAEAQPSTPEAYAADLDAELSKWSTLVRSLGLKAD